MSWALDESILVPSKHVKDVVTEYFFKVFEDS